MLTAHTLKVKEILDESQLMRTRPAVRTRASTVGFAVSGWILDVIDDEDRDRSFGGDEFEAELLLNRRVEAGWCIGITAGASSGVHFRTKSYLSFRPGLIHDRFVQECVLHAVGKV